ncbi:MAG: 3-hydroxyacyl-CoA dehydrogenase family protein [Planctomycetota bacterium]
MTNVTLVGLGVVGRAVLKSHLDAGIPVRIVDRDPNAVGNAIDFVAQDVRSVWNHTVLPSPCEGLHAAGFEKTDSFSPADGAWGESGAKTPLLIESIAEKLDLKRTFFETAEKWCSPDTVFCTNTSTLPIGLIGQNLTRPERLVGMHFFMPVDLRDGVEIIASDATQLDAVVSASDHVRALGKRPFRVGDSVGFVVNRLLAPYINQALELLCRGASVAQIEQAALRFGMPLSPLELIDTIGTRTAFDGGRTYWQAFPDRMVTSPLLPALIKKKCLGRHSGGGFYEYTDGRRSKSASPVALQASEVYRRDAREWSVEDLAERFAAVVWVESACIMKDRVVPQSSTIDTAMRDGLGFGTAMAEHSLSLSEHIDRLGWMRLRNRVFSDDAVHCPEWLADRIQALETAKPVSGTTHSSAEFPRPTDCWAT